VQRVDVANRALVADRLVVHGVALDPVDPNVAAVSPATFRSTADEPV
jgi:hypothetical protein